MRKTAVLLLVLACLLPLSCSKKTVTKKVDNPGVIYVEGVELMKKKKWDQAIAKFAQIRENYPFDPMADVAAVKLGDVYFERKEYLMASSVYTDFLNSHPDDENAPYVLWRLGESFDKLSLTIDRDQTYTLKAIERFTYLQNRYPETQYAKDAAVPLQRMTQKLADRELYVGEFYYKTGNYNAAVTRLEYFITKYPTAKGIDQAYFILSASYKELDEPQRANLYHERLVKEYPDSPLLAPKGKKVTKTKVTVADAASGSGTGKKSKQITVRSPTAAATTGAQKDAATGKSGTAQATTKPDQKTAPATEQKAERKPEAAPPADKSGTEPLPRLTEEKKLRQIELYPPAEEAAPAEPQKLASADSGQATKGKGLTGEPPAQGQVTSNGQAGKPEGKGGALGFFNTKKPVDIVSDSMEGLEKGKIIIFKGNVLTKQDDLQIFSDTLTAYLNEETNEVEKADAEGNVKIVKGDRTATCRQALFENAKGEITLKGNVVVYSGADRLAGETVIYYINEDRVTVEGEKDTKARVTVQPKK